MKQQSRIKQYPIYLLQYAGVLFTLFPLSVISIIFYIGRTNNRSYTEIWQIFIDFNPTMHLYNIGCIVIGVTLWNLRLTITPQKIYYTVWDLPMTLGIQKHEIHYCQMNHQFDAPLTWMVRKLKTFNSNTDLDAFDKRMGTVEFVFIHQQPINWLRHKFSLMYLLSFSKKQRRSIVQTLEDDGNLKSHKNS